MDKKEKILEFIKSQPWGDVFFKYLKKHGINFSTMLLDRYLICSIDWGNDISLNIFEWLNISLAFTKWYDAQNFED